ncbi:protein Flattop isoform X1 [Sciurus carolinensis]|uniref:protein Flattop isoform X1 n=1 Tax=Sciurus carolinensis TaxID=30640 RepID=UPI001FB53B40|nr:protein Flattop isoform X1 [Sciurus carolinensis]
MRRRGKKEQAQIHCPGSPSGQGLSRKEECGAIDLRTLFCHMGVFQQNLVHSSCSVTILTDASPWGTFMGTWQMPSKIPPARVTLTSRTTAGAASLTEWIQKNPDLLKASNGLCPEILGKPHDPDSQKNLRKKSITKTVQAAPSPTIIPNFTATNPNSPDQPQSSHPSAGHTPGPQSPVNSLKSPTRSASVLEH